MIQVFFTICILAGIAAIPNYTAYTYVQNYKYYKQVRSLTINKLIVGIFLGLPFIVIPFAYTESDQGFMKYPKVKSAIYWARIATVSFLLTSLILTINFFINK